MTIEDIIEKFKSGLTLDGKKRVFEDNKELSSSLLLIKSDPEAYTKDYLINPILEMFNLEKLTEVHFDMGRGVKRKVDYYLKNKTNVSFLIEAKSLNKDLFIKDLDGGVNQIKDLFRLAEVREKYEFGIATDGVKWVFIDKFSKIVYLFNIQKDILKIKEILSGNKEVSSQKVEEEISQKFYDWYNSLLYGGRYRDHDNKIKSISESDCLIENIKLVSNPEDRSKIAQVLMDRLIFIKFLQSKGLIGEDILNYLSELDEASLNNKLKELFFQILNTKKRDRINIDTKFRNIPYLNGSLFSRIEPEQINPDYKIKSEILKEVINFLNSFKFVHTEDVSNESVLDPEILGYIFERAMTASDRKGTGAFYTPKIITKYLSENTIHSVIINKTNNILKLKGYKDNELVNTIDHIYSLRETTLQEVFEKILIDLKICDPACGSGAFLLAAADTLLDVYKNINSILRLRNSEIALKKLILNNNIYGVDINENAIEIAKLRLWLWLVNSYNVDTIESLPNIDYNVRDGNSLLGYIDINKFKNNRTTLYDFSNSDNSLNSLFRKRESIISSYKNSIGEDAKKLRIEINELDKMIKNVLNSNLFSEFQKYIGVGNTKSIKTFHWGYEFYNIFNKLQGFDVILGNPPYISAVDHSKHYPEEREIYRNIFPEVKGSFDLYAVFLVQTLKLLNSKDGTYAWIIPNKLLISDYAKNVVEKLKENGLYATINVSKFDIFKKVGVYPIIILGNMKLHSYQEYEMNKIDDLITNNFKEKQVISTKYKTFKDFNIKIASGTTGFQAKAIKQLIINGTEKNSIPFAVSGSVDPYHIDNKVVRYMGNSYDDAHIKFNGDVVAKSKWDFWNKEKIIIAGMTKRIEAVYIKTPLALGVGCYAIYDYGKFNPKFLLGVLNSKFLTYYLITNFKDKHLAGGYLAINKSTIEKLPLVDADKNIQEKISSFVDEIYFIQKSNMDNNGKKKRIMEINEKIDEMVYVLYNISKEERKTIEESLK